MTLLTGRLLSLQAGLPKKLTTEIRVDFRHANWTSAIFKSPVAGPVWCGKLGLTGDGQADLDNHGGPHRALLAYAADHYPIWRRELEIPDLPFGGFGENLTVAGFHDDTVCIGDQWQIGDVLLEVSQPRQPCYKLARRLQRNHIVKMVSDRGWGGWYLRVLREGYLEEGTAITQLSRPHPAANIADVVHAMYARKQNPEAARQFAEIEQLNPEWREALANPLQE